MSDAFDKVQFVTIEEDNHLQRIDNYLVSKMKGVPKSKIYRILRKGEVRVNKKRAKPDYKLQINDYLRIPPVKIDDMPTQQLNVNSLAYIKDAIIYEDDRLLVINKPSGMAVHGGSGLSYGLIEALRALRPNSPYLELVHRLDRDTSGCIVLAKKRSALRHLHEQLRDKKMDKTYHALVAGHWPEKRSKVSAGLQKNQIQSGERMVFADENGKHSETRFSVIGYYPHASLLEAKPITGRTHQIRVHCQFAGHAIANDSKYGDEAFTKYIKNLGCKRLFLHAKSIEFIHPASEKLVKFEAPYDKHLAHLIKALELSK
ncbi:23S rRNA pseudouridine955/2504/2580 synthase [Glaciecola punicea ACAM 611]|jgi:23S rRNA pseudouridine955/2504/2580 synthase|uniref:Pseudouridine synthase n=1 Tax=Glaciecola punicea ACAM 611 TaxID=1121923 RepID=H5T9F0_9ALTE|nr:23S rRNA pseudouridine(955/2504/2580) synthase RluC [Glaciecola punicea]OFA33196.1 23S rRNA pseudouridine(955/2504/2580) synthase [Glaciecola punicea]GAB54927.1 23S rRNA pseudouridine955/2504/2580 synthase [Glaciecola punicea ACAM 611]